MLSANTWSQHIGRYLSSDHIQDEALSSAAMTSLYLIFFFEVHLPEKADNSQYQ
jgi:hypothetical protein